MTAASAARADGHGTMWARALGVTALVALSGCPDAAVPPRPLHPEEAESRLERECGAGVAAACAELAGLVAADTAAAARALGLHARACRLGEGASCVALARSRLAGPAPERSAAPELLGRACELGEAAGCFELGQLHRRGALVPPDLAQSRALIARACAAAAPLGCAQLGRMQQRGLGGLLQPHEAIASFRRGCEHDDAAACFELGRVTELGHGQRPDPAAAYDHYRRAVGLSEGACEAGDLAACNLLGSLLREGSGTPLDRQRGLELQRRACDAGHVAACVSWMTRGGSFALDEADAGRADDLGRSCVSGVGDACLLVARIGGAALSSTRLSLRQALDRGCELGSAPACNAAGLERIPPDARGRAQLERACALGDAVGCHALGMTLELEGDGVDAGAALELQRLACQAGLAAACTRVGALRASAVGGAPDPHAAATSWERGCALGDPRACYELGVLLQDGRQVPARPKAARGYLQRACRGGERAACTRLGARLWRGLDGERDPARGQTQVIAACEQLEPQACLELAAAARRGEAVVMGRERLAELLQAAGLRSAAACEDAVAICHDRTPSTATQPTWTELDGLPARLPQSWPECGIGLERRCEQARELLAERCGDDAAACFRAARVVDTLLARGLGGRGAERDRLQADGLRLATRACAGGDAASCRLAARAQHQGWGTKADPDRARLLEARACKLEPAVCPSPTETEPSP